MSLAATMMQDIRTNGNIDKYEYRASRYGALSLFQKQTNDINGIISPEMEQEFWSSVGRNFTTAVIDYENVSIKVGEPRSITVGDSENTSKLVTITPTSLSFGFTMVPSLYLNNDIGYQKDFNIKMLKYLHAMATQLDNMCITKLITERTTKIENTLGYDYADGLLVSSNAKKSHIIGSLDAMMNSNDFYDTIDIVGDAGLQDLIAQLRQHGTYNDQNKQLEYAGKNLYYTNRLPLGQDKNGKPHFAKGIAVNAGSVGLLWRVDRESLVNRMTNISYQWTTGRLPMLDIPIGIMEYESVGDYSGIAGNASADMSASYKQHYGFSVDVALVCAYNSLGTERATPIIEFGIEAEA
jgi:hypothetical protein